MCISGKFGDDLNLAVRLRTAKLKFANIVLHARIRMTMPYRTAKFKYRQYFRIYGI